uniref:Uncharacterized protein n=1 Tax=Nelumbo nucifera TaxID=4432 RepID=A0A822ZNF7_NELNU|nr:TPA_asm: hypothetical protein HUJ06_016374 [Nelumbo nucifera]
MENFEKEEGVRNGLCGKYRRGVGSVAVTFEPRSRSGGVAPKPSAICYLPFLEDGRQVTFSADAPRSENLSFQQRSNAEAEIQSDNNQSRLKLRLTGPAILKLRLTS